VIYKITVGPMECNCYIVACDETRESVIIDPGGDAEKIKAAIKKNSLTARSIVNTHGHGDHIGANGSFDLPIFIHRLDADFLTSPSKNLSAMFFFWISSPEAARLLEDGDTIEFGREKLSVIHTPGHTPGGICLKMGRDLFTGDTLFCGGIGRTDFPYGDEKMLMRSIKEKLLVLSDDAIIHPGHGPDSTIGEERQENPFL